MLLLAAGLLWCMQLLSAGFLQPMQLDASFTAKYANLLWRLQAC
jgi:hypothetical protein